jgi:Fur family transcriptional regulator, zinc uptake regulator
MFGLCAAHGADAMARFGRVFRPFLSEKGGKTVSKALHPRRMTATKPTFPAPDHDHDRCAADAIRHAEQVCAGRAQKFTPIRRQVLQALLSSHRPLGAYEVIDELAKSMPRPAPITVYRALDFLMENGLVHRIESRNAFLACAHDHDAAAMVAFLICERCGSVGEIPASPVAQGLNDAARLTGFAPKLSVVEITGTCAHCLKSL